MLEPWKKIYLRPPPVQTAAVAENTNIKELEHACRNILTVLSKQSPLHRESALLSRFLYIYDKKFRNDIGYRNIRKCKSTLCKYLQLNLLKDVDNFIGALPHDDDNYLPSRQMLEYILVRIITFSKLMVRVCQCSKQGAVFYLDRIKRGEGHWMSLMPYALLSRIQSICKVLLQHSVSWYTSLHLYLIKLEPKGLHFLPENFELPKNLEQWLHLKNVDDFGRFNWSQKKKVNTDNMIEDEGDDLDDILSYVNKINEDSNENDVDMEEITEIKQSTVQEVFMPTVNKIDHGEAVSRETFNILNNFQSKLIKNCGHQAPHYFGKVTNFKTLTEFLDKEEAFRNSNDKQSLTSHLSFMQWQTLKLSLTKVFDGLSKNRKIEKKLQKIWKAKCLEYL